MTTDPTTPAASRAELRRDASGVTWEVYGTGCGCSVGKIGSTLTLSCEDCHRLTRLANAVPTLLNQIEFLEQGQAVAVERQNRQVRGQAEERRQLQNLVAAVSAEIPQRFQADAVDLPAEVAAMRQSLDAAEAKAASEMARAEEWRLYAHSLRCQKCSHPHGRIALPKDMADRKPVWVCPCDCHADVPALRAKIDAAEAAAATAREALSELFSWATTIPGELLPRIDAALADPAGTALLAERDALRRRVAELEAVLKDARHCGYEYPDCRTRVNWHLFDLPNATPETIAALLKGADRAD